jgi:hypothetical protein
MGIKQCSACGILFINLRIAKGNLQKHKKNIKAFLIFFIVGLSLKGIANFFGGTCFHFLNIKARGSKPDLKQK